MIEGFQQVEEKGVAIPANWPENELIGKGLIIPPAADVESVKKNPLKYKNFDWWLCYRNYYKW
ncbi:MAG: hypothetical protein K8E24_004815 [Methanobacterium paludis]|nr:hypothetical protein [Methanobacterium paludis]